MPLKTLPRRAIISTLIAVTVLLGGLALIQATSNTSDVIQACVDHDGEIRLLDPRAPDKKDRDEDEEDEDDENDENGEHESVGPCKKKEILVTWDVQGPQGGPGPQGDAGPAGSQGPKGDPGADGLPGADGAGGAPGAKGDPGADGLPGADGADGTPGAKGDPGADGLPGADGTQGIQGIPGPQGPQGLQGATGTPGIIGPQGLQGATGTPGIIGPTGPQGLQGASGTPGITGPTGPQGLQGDPGPVGLKGATGTPGIIGPTGPQGLQGATGTQGITGPPGPAVDLTDILARLAVLETTIAELESRIIVLEGGPTTNPSLTELYVSVLDILGTSTGVILAFGDPDFGLPDDPDFTTAGAQQFTFEWSEPPSGFDSPLDLNSSSSFQGIVPIVELNGTDEEADSPDAAYWSRAGEAFSMGVWLNMRFATSSTMTILSKYQSDGAENAEWRFRVNASDRLNMLLTDESATNNPVIQGTAVNALPEGQWVFMVATIDGTADASGINLYQDGALVASTYGDNQDFVTLGDLGGTVKLGHIQATPIQLWEGKFAGGPFGPFFTHKQLSPSEIQALYDLGRVALDLP